MFDEPKDALKFVAAFLPGFLGFGLACYLVDLRFDEFYFVFIAVALSALSYAVAARVMGARPWLAHGLAVLLSLGFGLVIALVYNRDWAFAAVNSLPLVHVTKTSQQNPFHFVLEHLDNCASIRPLDRRENLTLVRTQTLVRVVIKDFGTVEGFPRVTPTELDPNQIFLSPACKIDGDTATAIPGPGVLIQADNALAIELIDATASKCWAVHYAHPPCLCPPSDLKDYLTKMNIGRPPDRQFTLCKEGQ